MYVIRGNKKIPLYFFILEVISPRCAQMKGIWKSLTGEAVVETKGKAIHLLRWAFSQYTWEPDALALVNARASLKSMFDRNGLCLNMIETIPKRVQGFSVPAQFYISTLF